LCAELARQPEVSVRSVEHARPKPRQRQATCEYASFGAVGVNDVGPKRPRQLPEPPPSRYVSELRLVSDLHVQRLPPRIDDAIDQLVQGWATAPIGVRESDHVSTVYQARRQLLYDSERTIRAWLYDL